MKKTILVLLVIAVAASAQKKPDIPRFNVDDWEYLAASDAMRFYFSKKAPAHTGQTTRAWERVEFKTDTVEGRREQQRVSNMTTPAWEGSVVNVASYVVLIEYDCTKNKFKERRFIFYDADGAVIEALPDYDGYEWKQVSAKTVRDALKEHTCESASQPASVPRDEAEQIVAGERGIAPFSTSFVRRGLSATARAT